MLLVHQPSSPGRAALFRTDVGPVLLGAVGDIGGDRVRAMAQLLGGVPEVLSTPEITVHGRGAVLQQNGLRMLWSHSAPPGDHAGRRADAFVLDREPAAVRIQGTQSGAIPVYVDVGEDHVTFSSVLDLLIRTRPGGVAPDWNGVAQMVAGSGPLGGRTVIAGIDRLRPGEQVCYGPGRTLRRTVEWQWPQNEAGSGSQEELAEAVTRAVSGLARSGPLISMLSGGWDSRLLLAAAHAAPGRGEIQAFTTSSDTGTVMEELVAAQVAEHLGVSHQMVMPHRSQFAADLADFAAAADYQTAFHLWLVPLARAVLAAHRARPDGAVPTVLDGLGGGLFIGSSFSDDPAGRSLVETRLAGVTRYLGAADRVLRTGVVRSVTDRIRADAEPAVHRFRGHPYGHILTAYLTRTVPGISLAPHGLMARTGPVATPFLCSDVVSAGLRIQPLEHAQDRLYPLFTSAIDPALSRLPTAQAQVPWPRPHPRRITSMEAVRHLRSLLLREPVRALVAPSLLQAGPKHWRALLATTGGQHLIRGLAVLSLWCDAYGDMMPEANLQELG